MRAHLLSLSASLASLFGCAQNPKHVYLQSIPDTEYDRNILYYADQAPAGTTLDAVLDASDADLEAFSAALPADKLAYRYARGKWTVAQVLQHVITYEHIMRESLLDIATRQWGRGPAAESVAEPEYAVYSQASTATGAEAKSKEELLADFRDARAATRAALATLTPEQRRRVGRHEGFRTSPRVLVACIMGHQAHHFRVLRSRYGL